MMELRNPNIVRLIALCKGPPLMMVRELKQSFRIENRLIVLS
jgi:hypothetical protein